VPTRPVRTSVALENYPDLIMILLGFHARSARALPALARIGRGLNRIRRSPPDGLLRHEGFLLGWNHLGFRQYWRDRPALDAFTRSSPHSDWWRYFLNDPHGSGFWHEAYHAQGGVEAIYVAMPTPVGLAGFAPSRAPTGPFMTAADRLAADVRDRARAADMAPSR
jgi:hypothetical protein